MAMPVETAVVSPSREELAEKHDRVKSFLDARGLNGVVLATSANVAWYSGGADVHVAVDDPNGVAALLVERGRVAILTNTIEAARMAEEAFATYLPIAPVPAKIEVRPWYKGLWEQVIELSPGLIMGTDDAASFRPAPTEHFSDPTNAKADAGGLVVVNMTKEISCLRYRLTPREVERYRRLGAETARVLEETARSVQPGQTEFEVAAALDSALLTRGLQPTVTLVAADERIAGYRHPIPTTKTVERSCMLVTCARSGGLISAATRLVSFGGLSPDLRRRHDAVVRVDAEALAASQEGASMFAIFETLRRAYAEQGFPGEEEKHHQGGTIGYRGREYKADPNSKEVLFAPQAVAWNPSITGTKSEDTYLIPVTSNAEGGDGAGTGVANASAGDNGMECLTFGDGSWPMLKVKVGGRSFWRPDILVRHAHGG